MKRFKLIACSLACAFAVLLCGCSSGGDFVNCFTNGCASFFEGMACFNGSLCGKCAASYMTCGFCGGLVCSGCGTYDCLTGFTCYACAEDCRSHIKGFDSRYAIEPQNFNMNKSLGIEKMNSVTYDHGEADDYYRVTGNVVLTFAEGYTADNVWLECRISTKKIDGSEFLVYSNRWLGSVKSGKEYKADPVFYVVFSNKYSSEAQNSDNYDFTVSVYYGE